MQSPLSTAVVTALLQMFGDHVRHDALEILFYTSMVVNVGATTFAVLCLIILSDITTKARVIAATDINSLPRKFLLKDRTISSYLTEDRERKFAIFVTIVLSAVSEASGYVLLLLLKGR